MHIIYRFLKITSAGDLRYSSRSYEIVNENYFRVRRKNRRKHNKYFKLLFFKNNLHFVTSNQISIYRKQNLSLTSSIYLDFLPLEMQKRLKHNKVYHTFFYFVWKGTTHKSLKPAATKTLFSVMYVLGITCFDNAFILCDNWKTLLFIKNYRYSEIF